MPDFPAHNILFRDITTLVCDGRGLASAISYLARRVRLVDAVAGVDARGFIFGAALATRLGVGFVPLRKAGKLPVPVISEDYALEYGRATLELDPTAIRPGQQIVLVDDLIATGGTAVAGIRLLRRAGALVDQALFVIGLPDLGGTQALHNEQIDSFALLEFPGH